MTPTQADLILGAVSDLRVDMGGRFKDAKDDLDRVNAKLDSIDGRVGKVEMAQAIAFDRLGQAKAVADARSVDIERHVLSFRWRVTIAVSAVSALVASTIGVLNFVLTHMVR